jgi:hypothetical protein
VTVQQGLDFTLLTYQCLILQRRRCFLVEVDHIATLHATATAPATVPCASRTTSRAKMSLPPVALD